jgi:phosphoribosylformylglycinamidine (FGAM) synthase PurS component
LRISINTIEYKIRIEKYLELTITANNTTLTDPIKKYAEKRLSILEKNRPGRKTSDSSLK